MNNYISYIGQFKKKKAKLRFLCGMIVLLSLHLLISCGTNDGNRKVENEYINAGPSKYIELPEGYLDFSYEEPEIEITEEMVDNKILLMRREDAEDIQNNDGPIENGDKIEITYEAKNESGTIIHSLNEPYKVTIGDGYMSNELNDALIGHYVGETVMITNQVSDKFSFAEELQGQNLTYEIKILGKYYSNIPDLNDVWVQENTNFDTVDELRLQVYDNLYNTYYENAMENVFSVYWDDLVDRSLVTNSFPEELVDAEIDTFHDYILTYGVQDIDDDIYKLSAEYGQEAVKMKMVLYAFAEENDLIPTINDFKEYCENEIEGYGYDEDTFKDVLGQGPYEYGLENGWLEEYLNKKMKEVILN